MNRLQRHVDDLADELINEILVFLVLTENQSIASSPVNSLELSAGHNGHPDHVYGEETDLDRFRLVCKRFCRISTPRRFTRFHLRFSRRGFRRLEELMQWQLACHVKHFTYMVRPFYQGSGWLQFLADIDPTDFPAAGTLRTRLQDQTYILDGNHDYEMLKKAMAAFISLKQVKLLRLQDQVHERVLDYLRERSLERTLTLNWEPACTRAVASLGISLLASSRTSVGFVGPQIDPKSTIKLLQTPTSTLSAIGARLTTLEVNFYARPDLKSHMEELSHVFHEFFLAAKNLESIHLGLVTATPMTLSLDRVFHRIQWKRLRKLSIQGWRLDSQYIIALVRRHRRQLRDVRLVNVFLSEGGRWRDVLSVLHDEMDEIEHIDLRDINYAIHLDHDGMHGSSSQGISFDIGYGNAFTGFEHQTPLNTDYLALLLSGLPGHIINTPIPEAIGRLSVDELGDDGIYVRHSQRQLWEAWVLSSSRRAPRGRF